MKENIDGKEVLNQPAGHLEDNESLVDAVVREVLEETGWEVNLTGVVGYYAYTSPHNGVTYYRVTFAATPLQKAPNAELDRDIIATHWFSYAEILAAKSQLRSPIVLKSLQDYRSKKPIPLDFIFESHPEGWLQQT